MGMNAAQFVQVALLPQGEFQTFLRASSQERHAVLQHLFRTDRFARIEDWVHDHSRDLKVRSGRDQADVQRLLDGVADRAGVPTPDDLTGDDLAQAASDGRVVGWALDRLADARAVLDTATLAHAATGAAVAQTVDRHAEAVRARELATRVAAARAELQALEVSQDRPAPRGRPWTPPSAPRPVGRCSRCSTRPSRRDPRRPRPGPGAGLAWRRLLASPECPVDGDEARPGLGRRARPPGAGHPGPGHPAADACSPARRPAPSPVGTW